MDGLLPSLYPIPSPRGTSNRELKLFKRQIITFMSQYWCICSPHTLFKYKFVPEFYTQCYRHWGGGVYLSYVYSMLSQVRLPLLRCVFLYMARRGPTSQHLLESFCSTYIGSSNCFFHIFFKWSAFVCFTSMSPITNTSSLIRKKYTIYTSHFKIKIRTA
jgi:hypothetical protein